MTKTSDKMSLTEYRRQMNNILGFVGPQGWERAAAIRRNAQASLDCGQISRRTYNALIAWAERERIRSAKQALGC